MGAGSHGDRVMVALRVMLQIIIIQCGDFYLNEPAASAWL